MKIDDLITKKQLIDDIRNNKYFRLYYGKHGNTTNLGPEQFERRAHVKRPFGVEGSFNLIIRKDCQTDTYSYFEYSFYRSIYSYAHKIPDLKGEIKLASSTIYGDECTEEIALQKVLRIIQTDLSK